jgi:hypothetical protein
MLGSFDVGEFIPIVALSIPIIAILGGITAGIVKTMGRQRLIELAQRERIAAIERGIDPSKLPPLPAAALDDDEGNFMLPGPERDRRRAQGLMIGGVVTLATGIGIMGFFRFLNADTGERGVWAVGIIPAMVGFALLISSWLVRPRDGGTHPPSQS